ncbi:ABC-2 type transport system permease protein [Micromonospora coriariae]|uniref:Transport permease protein n=1 Tax=Micromonospora coriariae TaxID=285665 RepID=A0A1C4UM52_9ACTN|nr:ABC transporter permease [Micromonospora coriariae]SCE72765.1 ABC-2 type transport system permease protein [Micromonospora coriariae]
MTAPELTRMPGALVDVGALVGRGLRRSLRSVDALITAILLPVLILLAFVYVFGGAIETGTRYLTYVVPGIVLICAAFGSASTGVGVNQDMTTGMVARLRSLPVLGSAVLIGHIVASVARNLVSTAIVVAVSLLLGFRPTASVLDWVALLGLLALFMCGISALSAAFGLLVTNAEAAGAFSFVVLFLPYVSSAFVPPETMPDFLQGFARNQPMTPLVETVRGLLVGGPAAESAPAALAWAVGFLVVGVTASGVLFRRRASR